MHHRTLYYFDKLFRSDDNRNILYYQITNEFGFTNYNSRHSKQILQAFSTVIMQIKNAVPEESVSLLQDQDKEPTLSEYLLDIKDEGSDARKKNINLSLIHI